MFMGSKVVVGHKWSGGCFCVDKLGISRCGIIVREKKVENFGSFPQRFGQAGVDAPARAGRR